MSGSEKIWDRGRSPLITDETCHSYELHRQAALTTTLHSSSQNMDLNEIIEAEQRYKNSTGQSSQDDFVRSNKGLAVPYLVLSALISVVGAVGNLLIIAAVCVDKVS